MNITLVIITWFGMVAPYMNKVPQSDWETCDALMLRTNAIYESARAVDPRFGFSLKCERSDHG